MRNVINNCEIVIYAWIVTRPMLIEKKPSNISLSEYVIIRSVYTCLNSILNFNQANYFYYDNTPVSTMFVEIVKHILPIATNYFGTRTIFLLDGSNSA